MSILSLPPQPVWGPSASPVGGAKARWRVRTPSPPTSRGVAVAAQAALSQSPAAPRTDRLAAAKHPFGCRRPARSWPDTHTRSLVPDFTFKLGSTDSRPRSAPLPLARYSLCSQAPDSLWPPSWPFHHPGPFPSLHLSSGSKQLWASASPFLSEASQFLQGVGGLLLFVRL